MGCGLDRMRAVCSAVRCGRNVLVQYVGDCLWGCSWVYEVSAGAGQGSYRVWRSV